jgi:hypothetical protein
MGKEKRKKQAAARFVVGTHGGCEARLFEFREKHLPEPHVVQIAAASLTKRWPISVGMNPDSRSTAFRIWESSFWYPACP